MFIDLLGLSAVSNLFFINILVASILINFGYWGFVLEKIQIAKNIEAEKAREQELKSTAFREYSEELKELVKQRDQMLMLVSKFASAKSMAVFNTAIIHELSQPIQSLSLCLEGLKINIDQNQWLEANTQIDNAHQLTQKMGATLHSLRSLIQTNKPDLETLQMSKTLGQLIPIVQSECKRNDIEFIVTQSNEDVFINANKVLLERIIMNLVANSIEAFQSMEHPSPKKYIKVNSVLNTHAAKPCWQLTVEDNASGFSDEALKSITDPFVTNKITGLGIGLSFASLIVRLWQGQLRANNRSKFEGGGAIITIEIPQNLQAEPA
jgi:C4-dicarboxylate-specific signal transduction histidine kinase